MTAEAPHLLIALEASGLGLAIRQSAWIYPAANVGHVVAVILFFAALAVLDLTLLGLIDARRRALLVRRARGAAMAALSAVVVTGATLFIAEASHVAMNRVFQVKVGLIALAGVNALVVGTRAVAAAAALPEGEPLPQALRLSAAASLLVWIVVAALGRYIAYH